jgi:glycosyltransferase involved in cell wall biosynthesis
MPTFDVSIIMPNFNCEPYIAQSIRSALQQCGVSVEVVFVDDASSDGSVAVAQAMADEFPGLVQVHRLERNSGSAVARNMALRHANGRWLAVLDSDDLMYPHRLAKLIEAADEQGADIIADDLLTFYDDGKRAPHGLLGANMRAAGIMSRWPILCAAIRCMAGMVRSVMSNRWCAPKNGGIAASGMTLPYGWRRIMISCYACSNMGWNSTFCPNRGISIASIPAPIRPS